MSDSTKAPPAAQGVLMPSAAATNPYAGMSDDAVRRAREQTYFDRKLQKDDEARASAGTTTLRCVASFVLHDDPSMEDGRTIRYGELYEVSDHDLPMHLGRRGVRIEDVTEPVQGVTVENT